MSPLHFRSSHICHLSLRNDALHVCVVGHEPIACSITSLFRGSNRTIADDSYELSSTLSANQEWLFHETWLRTTGWSPSKLEIFLWYVVALYLFNAADQSTRNVFCPIFFWFLFVHHRNIFSPCSFFIDEKEKKNSRTNGWSWHSHRVLFKPNEKV